MSYISAYRHRRKKSKSFQELAERSRNWQQLHGRTKVNRYGNRFPVTITGSIIDGTAFSDYPCSRIYASTDNLNET